jgi:apolipoprotein N-acyltransferase
VEAQNINSREAAMTSAPLTGQHPVKIRHQWALALASGILLGASFPPSPLHSLAYVGLIPLLVLAESVATVWRTLRFSYVAFLVFHVITLYWTGGFVVGKDPWMMIAGGALLLIHPLFYVAVVGLYLLVRNIRGLFVALAALPFLWIAFEYSHALGEFSFPWITLGNSQAYDLPRAQIAAVTSVYGISLFILLFNVVGFVLVSKISTGRWPLRSSKTILTVLMLTAVYLIPWIYGKVAMSRLEPEQKNPNIKVGIVQPNIDPWEKWGSSGPNRWAGFEKQLEILLASTRQLATEQPDLVVWPETAIPFRILLPQNEIYLTWLRSQLDTLGIPLLTGLPSTVWYDSSEAPLTASRNPLGRGYYDDFNSATVFIPGQAVGSIYRKIVLVPFAERIPYAETFRFLIEPFQWSVGIGMWGIGKDTVVFRLPRKDGGVTHFSTMICYESVYPNFVREFVKRGAEFLVIITNDSWWGKTPGAYQHASYASFRAIENRRWIVRVANGGISGLVDPSGVLMNATTLYSATTVTGLLQPRTEETFYARHGDVFAISCSAVAIVFVFFALLPKRKRETV